MNNPFEEEYFFDNLPDAILLLIFNRLSDAKSLIQCLLVCKRFASLIFQTHSIFLSIPPHKPISKSTHKLPINLFKILLHSFIAKPIQFLHHIIACRSRQKSGKVSYYSPNEVLKNFNDVKSLHIEVPCVGEKIGFSGSDSLLKWKAEFSNEFKNCVVLVAKSFEENIDESFNHGGGEEDIVGQVLSDEELKLQVIWTISCLIAASARHFLLKQILAEHTTLENVSISDVNKQGMICVGKDEIFHMRNAMKLELVMERSRVPDLRMKLWYVPVLKLPQTGYLMKEATLVVIRPVGGVIREENDCDLFGFDGEEGKIAALDEAVKKMAKMKTSYVMTMNSF